MEGLNSYGTSHAPPPLTPLFDCCVGYWTSMHNQQNPLPCPPPATPQFDCCILFHVGEIWADGTWLWPHLLAPWITYHLDCCVRWDGRAMRRPIHNISGAREALGDFGRPLRPMYGNFGWRRRVYCAPCGGQGWDWEYLRRLGERSP